MTIADHHEDPKPVAVAVAEITFPDLAARCTLWMDCDGLYRLTSPTHNLLLPAWYYTWPSEPPISSIRRAIRTAIRWTRFTVSTDRRTHDDD